MREAAARAAVAARAEVVRAVGGRDAEARAAAGWEAAARASVAARAAVVKAVGG